MKARIVVGEGGVLPKYQTPGSAGFDIHAATDSTVQPGEVALIPTALIVEVPEGYVLHICARSSTPRKKGLLIPHGVGILDQDYHGPEDKILIQYYNFTDTPAFITKGERIAQGVFVRIGKPEWEVVDVIKEESRGGFGSTGGHGKA